MTTPSLSASSAATRGVYLAVDDLLALRHLGKDLTLSARKRSQALLEGTVRTRYRGRGMTFAEVRPYQPGDDIRTIDWRVTARVQAPYTKLFQEERERPVLVMVDQRAPMFFGSHHCFKSVFAGELAALIGWIAHRSGDRIGALLFGDREQKDVRLKRSKHGLLALLHELVDFNHRLRSPIATGDTLCLRDMLTETSRVARPGSLVILLSDFHDFDDDCHEVLNRLARHSDLMAIHIFDRLEQQLPDTARLPVSDGQQRITLNTRQLAQPFAEAFARQQAQLRQACANSGTQYVQAPIDQTLTDFARSLFNPRQGGRRASRGTAP